MLILKYLSSLIVVTLMLNFVLLAECYSATHYAKSVSYVDVSSTISSANPGDTIVVPSGSATWTSNLKITKGINIIGNGIGNTIIINGTSNHGYLIQYTPSNYGLDSPFRITGFTFNLNNNGGGIALGSWGSPTPPFTVQTNIRVDHNRFHGTSTTAYQAIWVYGGMYGVIDNNKFDNVHYPVRNSPQIGNSKYWDNYNTTGFAYNFGDKYVMYFEDNTFTGVSSGVVTDCQYSGRYVWRYNTIQPTIGSWPLFDLHGNDHAQMWSSFGGEIYGNQINSSYDVRLVQQRGGKMMIFNNNATSTVKGWHIDLREEYADSTNPTTNPQPQHISDSSYWNNRKNFTGTLTAITKQEQIGDLPKAGREYFTENTTPGVACGTLDKRPSICTVGQKFWASSQSCNDLTGMVGVNPAKPISGTLYKCTSSNNWTAYYTPYTYPHPLRTGDKIEENPGGIAAPNNLKVN